MLESEASGGHSIFIVKYDVEDVLLATDAIVLTAGRVDWDLHEYFHLLIEAKPLDIGGIAFIRPLSGIVDKLLEWLHPREDRGDDRIFEQRESVVDFIQIGEVVFIGVVDVFEY